MISPMNMNVLVTKNPLNNIFLMYNKKCDIFLSDL